jgi:cytochrome d ubiquinol oxidase subunit I
VTHSIDGTVAGVDTLERQATRKIENGIPAVQALHTLSKDPKDAAALAQFDAHEKDLGYGFLVQRYAPDLNNVTPAQVQRAARDTIPPVAWVFWSFRAMVGFGLLMLAFFVLAVLYTLRNKVQDKRWFLIAAVWMIPVPFLANECGWLVADLDERFHAQRGLHGVLADRFCRLVFDLHRDRDVSDGARDPTRARAASR